MSSIDNNCTGSVVCFKGINEPEGWIFCDGMERLNNNGIYNKLIEEQLGTFDSNTNLYTPPNYDNSVITKVDESRQNLFNLLHKLEDIRNTNYIHTYVSMGKVRNYNNKFFNHIYKVRNRNKQNRVKESIVNEYGVSDRRFEEDVEEVDEYYDSEDEYEIKAINDSIATNSDIMRWIIKI
jgi:hypothetical protein